MYIFILTFLFTFPVLAFANQDKATPELTRIVCLNVDTSLETSKKPAKNLKRIVVLDQLQANTQSGPIQKIGFDKLSDINNVRNIPDLSFRMRVLNCDLLDGKKNVSIDDVLALETTTVNQKIQSKDCAKTQPQKDYEGLLKRKGPYFIYNHKIDESHRYDFSYSGLENRGMAQITLNNNYNDKKDYMSLMCLKPFKVPSARVSESSKVESTNSSQAPAQSAQ